HRTDRPAKSRLAAACRRNPCHRQGSKFHRVSLRAELRDGVDELLIRSLLRAAGNRKRLAMGFGLERWRADIWHPDLNRPQPLSPQPLSMRLDLVSRSLGFHRSGHDSTALALCYLRWLHVTTASNRAQGR